MSLGEALSEAPSTSILNLILVGEEWIWSSWTWFSDLSSREGMSFPKSDADLTVGFLVKLLFENSSDCLHCILVLPCLGLIKSILQEFQSQLRSLILLGFEFLDASKLFQLSLVEDL